MSGDIAFPPAVLREYALIADGERGALRGPHGELVWLRRSRSTTATRSPPAAIAAAQCSPGAPPPMTVAA